MTTQNLRLQGALWRKSSRSATNGDCVEVALSPAAVGLRDSKNPGERLILTPTTWSRFLRHVRSGAVDRTAPAIRDTRRC